MLGAGWVVRIGGVEEEECTVSDTRRGNAALARALSFLCGKSCLCCCLMHNDSIILGAPYQRPGAGAAALWSVWERWSLFAAWVGAWVHQLLLLIALSCTYSWCDEIDIGERSYSVSRSRQLPGQLLLAGWLRFALAGGASSVHIQACPLAMVRCATRTGQSVNARARLADAKVDHAVKDR